MVTVSVADGATSSPEDILISALRSSLFWDALGAKAADRDISTLSIVIVPEISGFEAGSPLATTPFLVESLVDQLHARGYPNVSIGGSKDSTALWLGNRDIYAICELLGYRFVTSKGVEYKVVDLSEDLELSLFSSATSLSGTGLSRAWTQADFRIVFSKSRADQETGYALCLETLFGVLPENDKNLHYRRHRDAGEVIADLISIAPPDFCLVDAIDSASGLTGRHAPESVPTHTLIASPHAVLTDFVGALKMGLDPHISPIFRAAVRRHPLPQRYRVDGPLTAYPDWQNVPALLLRTTQYRMQAISLDRLIQPWVQKLDPELFPFKNPLDAQMNSFVVPFLQNRKDETANSVAPWLLTILNLAVGALGHLLECYRTLFDKDALRQRTVSLGLDVATYSQSVFQQIVDELEQLETIVGSGRDSGDDLRWRYVDEAVVFTYARTLPISFDTFIQHVRVSSTIQYMNDYIGGIVVELEHDERGRPVRQAERNLYLPQPNYLTLFHGKYIDVTKLEVVCYDENRHRLFWKTIHSENNSAIYDDGIATFARTEKGTRITITGRQLFTLPLFWQVFDLSLIPELKSVLVTDAYKTFFDRTIANFEALVEGREIRIGRPFVESAQSEADKLMELVMQLGNLLTPVLNDWINRATDEHTTRAHGVKDANGFVHFHAQNPAPGGSPSSPLHDWIRQVLEFYKGLSEAIRRDVSGQPGGS